MTHEELRKQVQEGRIDYERFEEAFDCEIRCPAGFGDPWHKVTEGKKLLWVEAGYDLDDDVYDILAERYEIYFDGGSEFVLDEEDALLYDLMYGDFVEIEGEIVGRKRIAKNEL